MVEYLSPILHRDKNYRFSFITLYSLTLAKYRPILNLVFTLIFAILFGLGLAFFAIQNTNGVTITLANIPLTDTPLWIIILVSISIGLICASFFNVLNVISSAFKLHGKNSTIKNADKTIRDLKSEIQRLKVENTRLSSKENSS